MCEKNERWGLSFDPQSEREGGLLTSSNGAFSLVGVFLGFFGLFGSSITRRISVGFFYLFGGSGARLCSTRGPPKDLRLYVCPASNICTTSF